MKTFYCPVNKYLQQRGDRDFDYPLDWEHWLRRQEKKLRYPYRVVILLLGMIAAGSLLIAFLFPVKQLLLPFMLDEVLPAAGGVVVLYFVIKAWMKVNQLKG